MEKKRPSKICLKYYHFLQQKTSFNKQWIITIVILLHLKIQHALYTEQILRIWIFSPCPIYLGMANNAQVHTCMIGIDLCNNDIIAKFNQVKSAFFFHVHWSCFLIVLKFKFRLFILVCMPCKSMFFYLHYQIIWV